METSAVLVISTYPSREEALEAGRSAVTLHLAACAQVSSDITSIYRWEGNLCTEKEIRLHLKTTIERESELMDFLKKSHPYKVPEMISIPVSSISPDYLSWVNEVVR